MAPRRSKDVDEIDDLKDMIDLLRALGINHKGLLSLDEMKGLAREALSKDKQVYPKMQASTILLETRAENERKREELLSLFSRANELLNHLNAKEKGSCPLTQDWKKIQETMEHHISQLQQKKFHILVAGETGAGKSSLINLILEEDVLPSEFFASTSTICELKYGKERKFLLHFKEDGSRKKRSPKTVSYEEFSQSAGGANQRKGSIYEKIEIYWPHKLLEKGIAIVDSPGIGEEESMDEMVTQYLTQAYAFVYVIDTSNSGGVKEDRIEKLLQDTMTKVFDQVKEDPLHGSRNTSLEHEFQSSCALFVCNKWDCVLKDNNADPDEVKKNVIEKLKNCWPGLASENQVIFMSTKDAKLEVKYTGASDSFVTLMNSVRSMVLKSIRTRLEIHWRWLYYFLSWISNRVDSLLVNASRQKNTVQKKMEVIHHRLDVLKKPQSQDISHSHRLIEETVHGIVKTLIAYLKSDGVRKRFSQLTEDEVPRTFQEVKSGKANKIFQKKLEDTINEWEEEHHQFKSARESLVQKFQQSFECFEGQLPSLEGHVTGGVPEVSHVDPLPEGINFPWRVYVRIRWLFLYVLSSGPLSRFVSSPSDPNLTWEELEKIYQWSRDPHAAMKKLSVTYLSEAANETFLVPLVKHRLQEANQYLSFIGTRIPEQIAADKNLIVQLTKEVHSNEEITRTYHSILNEASDILGKVAFLGLKEAGAGENEKLEWEQQGSFNLHAGAFSTVYRGKITRHGGEQPVTLKVFHESLSAKSASRIIEMANQLSELKHPHIVKFYGTAVINEKDAVKAILVMELCKGNLREYLQTHPTSVPGLSSNKNDVLRTFQWVAEICAALDYIHGNGTVHMDLKLDNILLTEEHIVKMCDVGACRGVDVRLRGSFPYMAPEVFHSERCDFKADIYSFGIMLWEIWFGRRVFADDDFDLSDPQHFFSLVGGGCRPKDVEDLKKPPRRWKELMEECWDGDPGKRPTATKCEQKITELSSEWSG